jgi:hypothetical protein
MVMFLLKDMSTLVPPCLALVGEEEIEMDGEAVWGEIREEAL